jgi:Ca-activated chloride channel family protein
MIESPWLTGVKVEFDGLSTDGNCALAGADVFARRPVVVRRSFQGRTGGTIRVSGPLGERMVAVSMWPRRRVCNCIAGRRLWARRASPSYRLAGAKLGEGRMTEVTQLGLRSQPPDGSTLVVAVDEVLVALCPRIRWHGVSLIFTEWVVALASGCEQGGDDA